MKHRSSKPVFNIGIVSIVLIFVMLCLLTFSALSLVSAKADLGLSRKSADHTTEYYECTNEANDILFRIISCMEEHRENAGETAYFQNIREDLEGTDGITFSDDRHLSYSVPMGAEQLLAVSLTLSYTPYEDGAYYRIREWRTVSTHAWESDNRLPVYDPDSISDIAEEE